MRTLRGWSFVYSTIILSAMCAASLRAQSSQFTLSDVDTESADESADSGGIASQAAGVPLQADTAMPMALGMPVSQVPRAVAPSHLNYPAGATMMPMIAPASYNQPPYPPLTGPMMGQPAGYEMGPSSGPPQPEPMMSEYGEPSGQYSGGAMDGSFCPSCGGQGCDYCAGYGGEYGNGVLAGFISRLLPYAEGGRCAPRWYDISLDGMHVKRESVGEQVNFATFTRLQLGGQVVLSTGNLDYEEELGMRFNAAIQLFPGQNVEFSYFGLFNWASVATVSDPTNNLFSVFSGFGESPINGFEETDQSQFQSLRSSSTIDSFEINIRKRNTAPNCRLQYSWMWGARYVYLLDDIEYFTLGRNVGGVPVGQSDSDVRARNSLTGFQIGGDAWTTIVPGVSFGTDLKGGVYGNYSKHNTSVITSNVVNPPPAPVIEESSNNDIAFVGEASLTFIYRTSPNWTIRAGYTFLYLDGVALAADNFNPVNPFGPGRSAREVDDNSDVFYHGGFGGFEWMW